MDEVAQHAHGAQLPEGLLVFGVAGREVPERATGVGHNGQAVRLQVLQQRWQAAMFP